MLLSQLPNGAHALVDRVLSGAPEVGSATVQRLEELGFIAGEPVLMLRRGPGGREPLAVQIGETLFALRLVEAQCIAVTIPEARPVYRGV
jgi:ferrous iron transport protein A